MTSQRESVPYPTTAVTCLITILALAPASGTDALAQETTGSIEGLVSGTDGKPIAGVEVLAVLSAPKVERGATTNRDGVFRISALPLGEYEVLIQRLGFQPMTVGPVVVRLGRSTALPSLRLAPAGDIVERVEVVAQAPLIDPSMTTTGGNIEASVFDNLPVTRDYQSIAMLLPSVNVSFLGDDVNFGGASGYENRYFVDGIDMTDPEKGYGGTLLPPDFIREVEVKTGGYDAEYRSALGGMVNVVTPSGSDELSGKLIGYWTSYVVSEDPKQSPIALQQKDLTQYDAGFSLSGPLAKQRAWFFLAYDPASRTIQTEVPGIGYFEDSSTTHRFCGKVDWRVDGSNSLALTIVGDPTRRDSVGEGAFATLSAVSLLNPDPYLMHMEKGGVGISLRGTHVLGPRILLEPSLSYLSREDSILPATERGREEGLFVDAPTGVWSGGVLAPYDAQTAQWTADLKATWVLERHQVKAGAEYRSTEYEYLQGTARQLTRYSDTWFQSFEAYDFEGSASNRVPSMFLQDSWRIAPRFQLNYGLRWSREQFVSDAGHVVQTLSDEWQPRVGFVYQPGRLGTQRIYGSAARYYQEVSGYAVSLYYKGTGRQLICDYDHDPRLDPAGATCVEFTFGAQAEVPDLRGQSYDDYSLGYQRQLGERHRVGVRGVYRTFNDALDDALVSATAAFVWGNPGRGPLAADYPRMSRVYKALEFTVDGQPTARSGYLASYVLSENRGNYAGVYSQDYQWAVPNYISIDLPEQTVNAYGLLPNDRTHVLKGSGFYRFGGGFNVGASLLWQSGTPLNEFGANSFNVPLLGVFLQPRGSAGRTPSVLDLSLRADYTFLRDGPGRWKPRLILDVYHLFSGQEPVDYDQQHYLNQDADANQINPNPTYGTVKRYYPPMTARLGVEVAF